MGEGTHFVRKVVVIVLVFVCAVCAWLSLSHSTGTQARVQLPEFGAAIARKHHEL